jgi:tetratricopeptide (TPR) repeat protein
VEEKAHEEAQSLPGKEVAGDSYCNACGWKNPAGSKFCSQCGEKLQRVITKLREQPANPKKRPANVERGVGQQVFVLIGLGVLLVIILFVATTVSRRVSSPEPVLPAAASTDDVSLRAPLSGELADRITELDAAIMSDSSAVALVLMREKMYALAEGGRLDMAADVQSEIAEQTGLAEDWKTAGDLYYEWMTNEEQPPQRSRAAVSAVNAYQATLALDPDNLDVRTDMATAYLNTGSPMLGVTEIKKVLEVDPDHLNANFNYGLMLARINRTEEAIAQLERVRVLAPDSTSVHYQRASALIASIREQINL